MVNKNAEANDDDKLCGIAISRLGLNVLEFYELTPKEFYYAIEETNQREMNEVKSNYVRTRWLAKHIWNSRKRHFPSFIKDAKDIEPFPWEQETKQSLANMKVAMLNIFYAFKRTGTKKKNKK